MTRGKPGIFIMAIVVALILTGCASAPAGNSSALNLDNTPGTTAPTENACKIVHTPRDLPGTIFLSGDYETELPAHRGALLIWNPTSASQESILAENEHIKDFSTSSDGRQLAVFIPSGDSLGGQVVVFSGPEPASKRFSSSAWWGIAGWLDGERLVIAKSALNPAVSVLLRPANGDEEELPPTFPGIYKGYPPVFWGTYTFTEAVYSPTLDFVLYPKDPSNFVLWNRQQNLIVKEIHNSSPTAGAPVWFSSGDKFMIDLNASPAQSPAEWSYREELTVVETTGMEQRLTFLTDIHDEVEIRSYSLSDDERYAAFWFRTTSEEEYIFRLGVLDLESGALETYCVQTVPQVHAPIWSPESHQLLAAGYLNDSKEYSTIWLDLDNQTLAELGKGEIPVGWILK